MDRFRVSVLEGLQEFRRRGDVVSWPPGPRKSRGGDPRVLNTLVEGVFTSDVVSLNGLDDRSQFQGC